MVRIGWRQMSRAEVADFLDGASGRWAADLARGGGYEEGAARDKAESDFAGLFPKGAATEGHFLYVIEDEAGNRVGTLWFAERSRAGRPYGYLYDIRVDRRHRNAGVGRQAMERLEEEARARGYEAIEFNVFGDNDAARALYRSLSYQETFVTMRKDLQPPG